VTGTPSRGRIIVVMPNEPFPFGQANGRWCHALLKGLSDAGWSVRCFSVWSNPAWVQATRELFAGSRVEFSFYPLQMVNGPFALRKKWRSFRQPFSYPLSDALRRDVAMEMRKGYDILHLEQLWSGYLADGARALTSIHHLERLDLEGRWHPSLRFLRSKLLKTTAEKRLIGRLGDVRTTTDRLARAVSRLNPKASVHVVPIALDPALFDFSEDDRTEAPTIGFIGSMAWTPGYLAAERLITRIFPLVRARKPAARLLLVGWNAREALAPYVNEPGVEIVGNVPSTREYFFTLQALAYPLPKGSGMMAKVLEAMAYGVPVVTSTEGIEGFSAEHGTHALIADDDETFAGRILQVLDDGERRRALRRHARRLIEERYAPAPAAAALERVYATL
jgi:glycosyltransferase involved in cell wall biosynthesis